MAGRNRNMKKFYQKIAPPGILRRPGWSGITNILSGDSSVVVEANQVSSGCNIHVNLGLTTVASHRSLIISTNSIADDSSFIIVTNVAVIDTQQVVFMILEFSN